LLRKKKMSQGLVRRYHGMLDVDYSYNKIVICAYQGSIVKTC
jgi:hypothetical protein